MRGAQSLAEKYLKRRIYGWKKVGDQVFETRRTRVPEIDRVTEPIVKIEYGWP